jgi:hypothetical protein
MTISDREALRIEAAEAQIDRFIAQQHDRRPDPIQREESYLESVRVFNERQQEENRQRWYAYHTGMASLHRSLADEHQAKAARLGNLATTPASEANGSGTL